MNDALFLLDYERIKVVFAKMSIIKYLLNKCFYLAFNPPNMIDKHRASRRKL
jgi:hypothetical protein